MSIDPTGDGDNHARRCPRDPGLFAPVDQGGGRMEQEVDDTAIVDRLAIEQFHEQVGDLRPDARQG